MLAGVAGGDAGTSRYVEELGTIEITLPAGTSYVALPLLHDEGMTSEDVFGPEVHDIERLEVWDPSSVSWTVCHPGRPGGLSGESSLSGHVIRLQLSQPIVLAIQGTAPSEGWVTELQNALDEQLFGPHVTEAVTLEEIVEALEATGDFLLGRDSLHRFDLASGAWIEVTEADPDISISPGTVFHTDVEAATTTVAAASATAAASTESVAMAVTANDTTELTRQADPELEGAVDFDGLTVSLADYPLTGDPPSDAPGTIADFRYREESGSISEAIGLMALPRDLLDLTDLPENVPVKIVYSRGDDPQPVRYELMGLSTFKVGGSDRWVEVRDDDDALSPVMDTYGRLYGAGAEISIYEDGTTREIDHLASVYYDPELTVTVEDTSGETEKTGPVLDVAFQLGDTARAFLRAGKADSPLPVTSSRASSVTSLVYLTSEFSIEYDEDILGTFDVDGDGFWAERTFWAELETGDGGVGIERASSADGVTYASWQPIEGVYTDQLETVSTDDPATLRFYETGMAELAIEDGTYFQFDQDEFAVLVKFGEDDAGEFGLVPAYVFESKSNRAGTHRLKLVPTVFLRGQGFAQSSVGEIEDMLLAFTATFEANVDLASACNNRPLLCFGSGTKASSAASSLTPTSPSSVGSSSFGEKVSSALEEYLGVEAAGFEAAVAVVSRFYGDSSDYRFSLSGRAKCAKASGTSGTSDQWDTFYDVFGAFEEVPLDGSDAGQSPTSIEFHKSVRHSNGATAVFNSVGLDASFSLPSEWGWSEDRTVSGSLKLTHEELASGKVINRYSFQSGDLVSFSFDADTVPYFAVGDEETNLELSLSDLIIAFSATESAGTTTWERSFSGKAFVGTTSDESDDPDSRGFLMSLATSASSTSETSVSTGSSGWTAKMAAIASGAGTWIQKKRPDEFGGASVGGGAGFDYSTELEMIFQNIEADLWRMDSIRGTYDTSTSWALGAQMGFRAQEDVGWAAGSVALEREGDSWAIAAAVEDVDAGDAVLTDLFVASEGSSRTELIDNLVLGVTVALAPDLDDVSETTLELGGTVALGSKQLTLEAKNFATFAIDGVECAITTAYGSFTLSGTSPLSIDWDLILGASAAFDWLDGDACSLTLRAAGSGKSFSAMTFELDGAFPDVDLGWEGAYLAVNTLSGGWTKPAWSVGMSATMGLPTGLQTLLDGIPALGDRTAFPETVELDLSGNATRQLGIATLSPAFEFNILDDLSLKFESFTASKASPWSMDLSPKIVAGGEEIPADFDYDDDKNTVTIAATDASKKITFDIGDGTTMAVSGFRLEMYRYRTTTKVEVSGTAEITVSGTTYSGTLALSMASDSSVSMQLTDLSSGGTGMDLPDFGGVTVSAEGVSISVKKTGSGSSAKNTVAVTAAVGITLDEDEFGDLGGKTLIGTVGLDSSGNYLLSVSSGLPELSVSVDGESLPFSVRLVSLTVVKSISTSETTVSGEAVLSLDRPINTVLGSTGDTPFEIDATVGVTKKSGKSKVYVKVDFSPSLSLDFSLLTATGALVVPGIEVSTTGDVAMDMVLSLDSPSESDLSLTAVVKGSKVSFEIDADPPLAIDASPYFTLDFDRIAYEQAFPGFMGVAADVALAIGTSEFGFAVDLDNVNYILPASLPPSGFAFFDEVAASMRLLGFCAKGSVAMPAPSIELEDAKNLVSGLSDGFQKSYWSPLETALSDLLSGDSAAFRGPGVGNIAIGLPYALRDVVPESMFPTATWYEGDPDLETKVIEIAVLNKIYYAADLLPGDDIASAVVTLLKTAQTVANAFEDPMYLIELIPSDFRSGGFSLDLGGMLAASASYSIVEPTIYTNDGTCDGLPLFDELCEVAGYIDDKSASGLDKIKTIVYADALDIDPRPVSNQTFSIQSDAGTTFSGVVNDSWIELRPYISTTLDLKDAASSPDADIDVDTALGYHLKTLHDEYGTLVQDGADLASPDGRARAELFGSTATFQVKSQDGSSTLYWGSAPLGYTTTKSLASGELELVSNLTIEGRSLVSEVQAKFTPSGSSEQQDLGSVSRTVLKNLDEPSWTADAQDGSISGWVAEYGLDEASTMKAAFSDFGTAKFSGPQVEFTSLYPGSLLSDIRLLLETLEEFKATVFEYDTSAYALGLKLWAKFHDSEDLGGSVQKIVTDGRTVRVYFESAEAEQTVELRIVLEELAYYLTADRDEETAELGELEGATDISEYRVDGEKLYAEPFTVSLDGDESDVTELIVFDGGEEVRELLARAEEQREALLETDLEQFADLGLSVSGDPLVVKSLRIELDVGSVRATIRPGSIVVSKISDGYALATISSSLVFEDWLSAGPYGDESTYPSTDGIFLTESYDQTSSATTVYDLHEAMGTNVLVRSVTISSPARLAGTFTEMAEGQFQGTLSVNGEAVGVTADSSGMSCELPASPSTLTLLRNLGGSISGSLYYNGENRSIDFEWDEDTGEKLATFEYPTGEVDAGGFIAQAAMSADLSVLSADLTIYGEIQSNGYFKFTGDMDLTVLDETVVGAHYEISSTEGFWVQGEMNVYIAAATIEGRVHADTGASFTGSLKVLPGDTGIDATVTIDTSATQKLQVYGKIKVAGYTIATQTLTISDDKFSVEWSVGGSSKGASATLTFAYSNGFSIDADGKAWLKTIFGTAKANFSFSVDSEGTASFKVGPLKVSLNIGKMDVSIGLK